MTDAKSRRPTLGAVLGVPASSANGGVCLAVGMTSTDVVAGEARGTTGLVVSGTGGLLGNGMLLRTPTGVRGRLGVALLAAADGGTMRAMPALLAAPDTDGFFVGRFCLLLIMNSAYHTTKVDSSGMDLWLPEESDGSCHARYVEDEVALLGGPGVSKVCGISQEVANNAAI